MQLTGCRDAEPGDAPVGTPCSKGASPSSAAPVPRSLSLWSLEAGVCGWHNLPGLVFSCKPHLPSLLGPELHLRGAQVQGGHP